MARTKTISMSSFKGYLSNRSPIGIKEIQVFQGNIKVPIKAITFLATTPSMVPTNANKLIVDGNDETVTLPSTLYWDDRSKFEFYLEFDDYVYTSSLYIRIKSDQLSNWASSFTTYYREIPDVYRWTLLSTIYNCKFNGPGTFSELLPLSATYPADYTRWDDSGTPGFTVSPDGTDLTIDEVEGNRIIRTLEGLTNGCYYFELFKQTTNGSVESFGFCSSSFQTGVNKLSSPNGSTAFGFESGSFYFNGNNSFTPSNVLELPVQSSSRTFQESTIFPYYASNETVGVFLDLDSRYVTFQNLFSKELRLKIKIPWPGPTHFVIGATASPGNRRRMDINFGDRPFQILNKYNGFFSYDIPIDNLNAGMSSTNKRMIILDGGIYSTTTSKLKPKELTVNPNYKTDTKRVLLRKPNIVSMDKLKGDDLTNYTKIADSYQMVFPIETGLHNTNGVGYIKSTIYKVLGGNNAPIGTVVALVDIATLFTVATTNSDPITGEFEFKYLNMNTKYNIMALDPKLEWVTGIGGPYEAKLMPNAFKDNYNVFTV